MSLCWIMLRIASWFMPNRPLHLGRVQVHYPWANLDYYNADDHMHYQAVSALASGVVGPFYAVNSHLAPENIGLVEWVKRGLGGKRVEDIYLFPLDGKLPPNTRDYMGGSYELAYFPVAAAVGRLIPGKAFWRKKKLGLNIYFRGAAGYEWCLVVARHWFDTNHWAVHAARYCQYALYRRVQ